MSDYDAAVVADVAVAVALALNIQRSCVDVNVHAASVLLSVQVTVPTAQIAGVTAAAEALIATPQAATTMLSSVAGGSIAVSSIASAPMVVGLYAFAPPHEFHQPAVPPLPESPLPESPSLPEPQGTDTPVQLQSSSSSASVSVAAACVASAAFLCIAFAGLKMKCQRQLWFRRSAMDIHACPATTIEATSVSSVSNKHESAPAASSGSAMGSVCSHSGLRRTTSRARISGMASSLPGGLVDPQTVAASSEATTLPVEVALSVVMHEGLDTSLAAIPSLRPGACSPDAVPCAANQPGDSPSNAEDSLRACSANGVSTGLPDPPKNVALQFAADAAADVTRDDEPSRL